jgi:SAM-dependent methyltransferase
MDVVNTEQSAFWSELAPTWVELEPSLDQVSGAPGRAAMDRLDPRPGQHLLDLGCGAGATTRELAARVAPGGSVLGVDIAEGLVHGARRRAAEAGVDNVEFRCADVQAGGLGAERFDGAYSRFGVMFFADPVAAFANVRRSLRPDGALVFVCWQTVFDNEWMLVPGAAAMSVTGPLPMPGPDEPGPFSLGDPARLRAVLGAAGFGSVDVEPHNDTVVLSGAAIAAQVEMSMQIMATREAALREADDETRGRVRAAMEAAFAERVEDGELRLSRGFHVVRARS